MNGVAATSARPRVLLVSARADTGGGPEHVHMLLRGLSGRCDFSIACPREEPYWPRFADVLGERNMLEIASRKLVPDDLFRLRRFMQERQVDLVHSHGHGAGIVARLFAPAGSTLVHTHHGLHFAADPAWWRRAGLLGLQRLLERRTALSVFVSDDEIHAARRIGLGGDRSVVVPNGVAVPPEPRTVETLPDRPLSVATVSRFNAQKNPEGLLAVLRELSLLGGGAPRFVFDVYGEGAERPDFAARVDASGLGGMVRLRGTVPNLASELARHDVFFSCSRWEGLPLSVLEAMAAGLPVVLSEVDGHRDILAHCSHGAQGYALDRPDTAAAALERLRDPEVRARAGAAARRCVDSRYSLDTMLSLTMSAYLSVFQSHFRTVPA